MYCPGCTTSRSVRASCVLPIGSPKSWISRPAEQAERQEEHLRRRARDGADARALAVVDHVDRDVEEVVVGHPQGNLALRDLEVACVHRLAMPPAGRCEE